MTVRRYPARTNQAAINVALAALGFDPEAVVSITIDERGIDAEVQAYDAQGNLVTMYVDGEQVAASYSVFIPHLIGEQQ